MTHQFQPPDYANSPLLSDIVPAAAAALDAQSVLSADQRLRTERILSGSAAEARVVVVVLIDGMGLELLRARRAYTPFLRSVGQHLRAGSAGFPSTTANSLSSLGTGMLPGGHGIMGYKLLDPESGEVFNQLTGSSEVDPSRWVPDTTLFERLTSSGLDVVQLGEPKFSRGGLNAATLRGGRFRGSDSWEQRVRHAHEEMRAPGRRLVYFYWGKLDKTGHQAGWNSDQWIEQLEQVDQMLSSLASALGPDMTMIITADHGMVDVAHDNRIDLAEHPELAAGLTAVGGEPRAAHLYTRDGARDDTAEALRAQLAGRGRVMTRDEAIREGWFGQVTDAFRARIGDLVVVCDETTAIVDSRNDSPSALSLLGHHGGVSSAELTIPLLVLHG